MNKSILIIILSGLFSLTCLSIQADPATESLYKRLGGYTAISAVVDDLAERLVKNEQLGRFYAHRGIDGIEREKQLTKDFITAKTGGPLYYTGRNMKLAHEGMRMSKSDWNIFITLLGETLNKFKVPSQEQKEVIIFIGSLSNIIVEQ
ncbi:MAG: group 1 truncated hemoglobin [Methylococcales bacterium]